MRIGKIALTVISVITLIAATYLNRVGSAPFTAKTVSAPDVLSQTDTKMTPAPMLPSPSPLLSSPAPTPTPVPSARENTKSTNSDLDSFIYPSSLVQSKLENEVSLTSSDSADKITTWYKNKFNAMGMKATAYSQTNTNGNIKNSLSAAKDSFEVKVVVEKANNEALVSVNISIER